MHDSKQLSTITQRVASFIFALCLIIGAATIGTLPVTMMVYASDTTVSDQDTLKDAIGMGYNKIELADDIAISGSAGLGKTISGTEVIDIPSGKTLTITNTGGRGLHISSTGDLSITGEGTLIIQFNKSGMNYINNGIYNQGSLRFGEDLTVKLAPVLGAAIYNEKDLYIDGSLSITSRESCTGIYNNDTAAKITIGAKGTVDLLSDTDDLGEDCIYMDLASELSISGELNIKIGGDSFVNDTNPGGIGFYGGSTIVVEDGGLLHIANTGSQSVGLFGSGYGSQNSLVQIKDGGTVILGNTGKVGIGLSGGNKISVFRAEAGSDVVYLAPAASAVAVLEDKGETDIQDGANVWYGVPFEVKNTDDQSVIAGATIDTIWPDNPISFAGNTVYIVQHGESVTVSATDHIADTHIVDVTDAGQAQTVLLTRIDTTPPKVLAMQPNGSDVATSGDIVITFSKEIGTIGTVNLSPMDGTLGSGNLSADRLTYTLPYSGLAWNRDRAIAYEKSICIKCEGENL